MLSLPLRKSEEIDIITQPLELAERELGPHISKLIKPILQQAQDIRKKLLKHNSPLSEIANDIKLYVSIWKLISKHLLFSKDSINILFIWKDAFTQDKVKTYNPLMESVSMLYNLAMVYNKLGISIKEGEEAINSFLSGARIMEQIKNDLTRIEDITLDIKESSINMYLMLMKGQAQILLYESLLKTKPKKFNLLSRVAIQINIYYKNALKSGMEEILKTAGSLIDTMKFNKSYYKACAFYYSALNIEKKNGDKAQTMANTSYAVKCLKKIKDIMPKQESFQNFYNQCLSKNNNNTVDKAHEKLKGLIYNKPVPIENELNKEINGSQWLSKLISVEFKEIKKEFEMEVMDIINEARINILETDKIAASHKDEHKNFIEDCKSKESLNETTNEELELKKMKESESNEGLQLKVKKLIEDTKRINDRLSNIKERLTKEEKEDLIVREKYGGAFPISKKNDSWSKKPDEYLLEFNKIVKSNNKLIKKIKEKEQMSKTSVLSKKGSASKLHENNPKAISRSIIK